jgi:starch synthase
MKNKIKILITAAEVTPIAKVGGLGDVIGALPKALNKLGTDVRIIIPFYGAIDRNKGQFKLIASNLKVETAVTDELVNLYQTKLPLSPVPVYLIEHKFFNGPDIYGLVDIKKFIFFSRALLACLKTINFKPDVIHLNDWHTAAVTLFLKTLYKNDPFFNNTKTLYTIHNLANQGLADYKIIALNKFEEGLALISDKQKNPDINFMAQGILNSDLVNTVSPTYAREILTKEFGAGLEKILAKRKKQLTGILNGIDTDFFNPLTDQFISHNYSFADLNKKIENKLKLQIKLGLKPDKNIALAGMVTRFVRQKGLELITENFSELNCQFVFLGSGEKKYEDALLALARKYPEKFSVQIKFDEKLAHQIYAGSDIFLVPSRFEPCGLTQMIAMRYGSVPVVRTTGGLKDTVKSHLGFTFNKFDALKFYQTIKKALKIYYEKPGDWKKLQLNGLKQNFSWEKSAKDYIKLYKKLMK